MKSFISRSVLSKGGGVNQAKGLAEKLMSHAEAVSRFIHNGAQIALGGFTITRNPMAVIHEVIRQKIRDLHVVCHLHGQGLDLLIGGGCVGRLEIAYAGNGRSSSQASSHLFLN